jgi:hypothetical protein
MAKNDTPYFSHDANARNDERIIRLRMRHGAAGYGVYFMLLERLREESQYVATCDYEMIAFDLHVDSDMVKSVIEDFGLFEFIEDEGIRKFYSESFMRRMELKDARSQKRREAANKRWGDETDDEANAKNCGNNPENDAKTPDLDAKSAKSDANASVLDANAMQVHNNVDANAMQMQCNKSKVKESKEKERKKEISPKGDTKKRTAQAPFAPPTEEEVENLARQKGLKIDAAHFVAYYTAVGWKMGNSPMRDWEAAAVSWARRELHDTTARPKRTGVSLPDKKAQRQRAKEIEQEYQRQAKEAAPAPPDLMQRLDAIAAECAREREAANAAKASMAEAQRVRV